MRQRIAGQRNWHRLVPASSGVKTPLACEDRTLVGCARASFQVAEVDKRHRGSEKRVSRWQRGAWTGAQLPRVRKDSRGCKGVENRGCGGQAANRESPEPGAREGVAGQGVSLDGRHLGLLVRPASFTRSGWGRSRRLPRVRRSRERHDTSGGGDRDARGTDRTHRDGKTTPTAVKPRQTCGPPKRIALMWSRRSSSIAQARKRMTHREPTRRGCSYEEREKAEVGLTHRASWRTRSRKASRRHGAGRGALRTNVLTHEAAAPRWERCASPRGAFNQEGAHGNGDRGNPVDHDTTEGVPIAVHVAPQGAGWWRSRSRGWTRGMHRKVCVEPATRRSWNRRGSARDDDEGR